MGPNLWAPQGLSNVRRWPCNIYQTEKKKKKKTVLVAYNEGKQFVFPKLFFYGERISRVQPLRNTSNDYHLFLSPPSQSWAMFPFL